MISFDEVFAAFGGPTKYGDAIGIHPIHAGTMKTRGSIPPAYWVDTVAAAARLASETDSIKQRARLQAITLEALAEMAKAKRPTRPESVADDEAPTQPSDTPNDKVDAE